MYIFYRVFYKQDVIIRSNLCEIDNFPTVDVGQVISYKLL